MLILPHSIMQGQECSKIFSTPSQFPKPAGWPAVQWLMGHLRRSPRQRRLYLVGFRTRSTQRNSPHDHQRADESSWLAELLVKIYIPSQHGGCSHHRLDQEVFPEGRHIIKQP